MKVLTANGPKPFLAWKKKEKMGFGAVKKNLLPPCGDVKKKRGIAERDRYQWTQRIQTDRGKPRIQTFTRD